MTAGALVFGVAPAFAQPSPVEEVLPISGERVPERVAVPDDSAPAVRSPQQPAQAAPVQVAPAQVATAGQLAQTGIDTGTAAGAAALLLLVGGAAVYGARRRSATS